jgi:regulator of sirC expression with transglutaminase-like and TPR domain
MRYLILSILSLNAVFASIIQEDNPSLKLITLYNSLDPNSIAELFAFYELYPNTPYGTKALSRVWELFNAHKHSQGASLSRFFLPELDIQAIIALVNKQPYETLSPLSEEQLVIIETLSSHLKNRSLKGHALTKKEDLLSLSSEEIDLARALLLYQYDTSEEYLLKIRQYEATLDLMALQILARLPSNATDIQKIDAISHFIFHEMQFRFPPHSLMAKDVDLYTFLPSVLDNRVGVCLGVSILYLSIAQRLDLPLEIITPPGHIYVRYRKGETLINIETTARGIHIPSEMYLGINTCSLEERTMKEVVGMAFVNQASVLSAKKDYQTALDLYKKAELFMDKDPLLKMLMGIHYILFGEEEKGKALLKEIAGIPFADAVYKETMPEDILEQHVSKEALEAVFSRVDETRESILEKQKSLKKAVKQYPKFRAGLMQLAVSWLQLGRSQEALEILKRYHQLDAEDPTVNYYISILSMQRLHYKEAWEFFLSTKSVLEKKHHHPKTLKSLEYQLRHAYSEVVHHT